MKLCRSGVHFLRCADWFLFCVVEDVPVKLPELTQYGGEDAEILWALVENFGIQKVSTFLLPSSGVLAGGYFRLKVLFLDSRKVRAKFPGTVLGNDKSSVSEGGAVRETRVLWMDEGTGLPDLI